MAREERIVLQKMLLSVAQPQQDASAAPGSEYEIATYNLECQPTTFDFAIWLALVKSAGFRSVSFHGRTFKAKRDYPVETAKRRFEHILKPLCRLADIPIVEGVGVFHRRGLVINHMMAGLREFYEKHGHIWKFPYQKRHDHVCVTIRDSWRNRHRNSNRRAWDRFMSWLENHRERVVVLEDRENEPISIEERWDANCCTLNMCTNGGPGSLLICSDAPFLSFGWPGNDEDRFLQTQWHEMEQGGQFVWNGLHQRLVWAPDDFDVLVHEYAKWREQQCRPS
jgi:hypothetical protein